MHSAIHTASGPFWHSILYGRNMVWYGTIPATNHGMVHMVWYQTRLVWYSITNPVGLVKAGSCGMFVGTHVNFVPRNQDCAGVGGVVILRLFLSIRLQKRTSYISIPTPKHGTTTAGAAGI